MTTPTQAPPFPPAKVYALSTAFWQTKLIMTASQLGVFEKLSTGPASLEQLAEALTLQPTALHDFLDALVALELLERDGGRYSNSAEADFYLVPGKRYYMGHYLTFVDNFMRPTWDGLDEVLRTGRPQAPQPPERPQPEAAPGKEGTEFFEHTYASADLQRMFMEAQDSLSSEIAWEISRRIDWSRWTRLVDLGGARGNTAGILLQAHPHLTATVFDMPPIEPLFHEHMERLGVHDRAAYQGGDWFQDPLPEGDALLCGHALHNWTAEQRKTVIGKAYDAVRPGGVFMVHDLMIDEDRNRLNPLMLSLAMTLSVGGSGYKASECIGWMREAGFTDVEAVLLQDYDGHTVVLGHKRA
ncbi:methyltransferase [Actinomadura roseirufa]|uniref:methyltransferase n=1 Tax=Actinomadura roseirufa TaxID=2094049 RepID=UPI001041387E|nr:methyltransferase [Actinomadura roseirufa]